MEQRRYSLKELRARKDVNQAEVAQAVGVSPMTYGRWEKNPGNVAVCKMLALARYFEVDLSEIFF